MSPPPFPEIFSLRNEIGFAIAQCMHGAGARVVLVGRRQPELESAARLLGDGASYLVHDITDFAGAGGLIERASNESGLVTCLVNNAGYRLKKSAVDTTPAEFEAMLGTHVVGAHALIAAAAPGMIARRHGSILFTASMASLFGIPLSIAYTAAKTAMVGMVKAYATEFSPHGVRVNAIAPGWIETAMLREAFEGDAPRKTKVLGRTPMGKIGQPADIGWAAVYLASPAAAFVTGVTLPVDGGASIGF
jgi:NAD(P)-dependent dehydrogenase (short-subunit alcohol dehydrogenase family)